MNNARTTVFPTGAIQTEMEVTIDAPCEAVWKALIEDIDTWWLPDFHVAGKNRKIVLEPYVGGKFYEDAGEGNGVFWMKIITFQAPGQLTMAGHVAPPWGGPATSIVSISLKAARAGQTIVAVTDHVFGKVSDKLHKSLDEGWRRLFEDGLKKFVEKRK
jgi:uncharacterized protein YndB with AHSA1/START domain